MSTFVVPRSWQHCSRADRWRSSRTPGTPGISDPGYRLVKDARDQGLHGAPRSGPERRDHGPFRLRPPHRPLPLRRLPSQEDRGTAPGPPRAGLGIRHPRGLRITNSRGGLPGRHGSRPGAIARPSFAARPRSCTRNTGAARSLSFVRTSRSAASSRASWCSW